MDITDGVIGGQKPRWAMINGDQVLMGQDGTSRRKKLVRAGNVGTRILSARTGVFDNSTPNTFRAIIEIAAAGVDAVQPIFANGNTGGTYTVASCAARVLANLNDALPAGTNVPLPSGGVVPVAPGPNRRGYLLGDWVYLSSPDRTDGGKGAIVCFDSYVSTAANLTILGNGGSDNYLGWATRANRKWIMRHNPGDCVSTPANFVSVTNRIQSPIIGVRYVARGRVITAMGIGDSITDGRGSIIGEGFGLPACEQASLGAALEWANLGCAGASYGEFRFFLSEAVAAGIVPDIVVLPNGSMNSFSASVINDNEISACKQGLAMVLKTCQENLIHPVVWTTIPVNPSVKDFGASDSKRLAMNSKTLGYAGVDVMDFNAMLSGITDGDGQTSILAGATTDGIHPNDVGNALLAPLLLKNLNSYWL